MAVKRIKQKYYIKTIMKMKKLLLLLAVVGMVFTACESSNGLDDGNGNETVQPGDGSNIDDVIDENVISFSPAFIDVPVEEGTYEVEVSSPFAWQASSNADWIVVETESGVEGKSTLKFSVLSYDDEVEAEHKERRGTILVQSVEEGLSAELAVAQTTIVFKLDTQAVEYDYNGGSKAVVVNSSIDYEVVCDASWLTCSKLEDELRFSASKYYYTDKSRKAVITLYNAEYDKRRTLVVSQTASPYEVGAIVVKEDAAGIIYYIDENITKIMMLDEAPQLKWCTNEKNSDYVSVGTTDKEDGRVNMATIKTVDGWESKYPAFKWCADHGEGWYLPAYNELLKIHEQRETLNKTLEDNGFATLDKGHYWSSTEQTPEYAYMLYFYLGNNPTDFKYKEYRVRAVYAF